MDGSNDRNISVFSLNVTAAQCDYQISLQQTSSLTYLVTYRCLTSSATPEFAPREFFSATRMESTGLQSSSVWRSSWKSATEKQRKAERCIPGEKKTDRNAKKRIHVTNFGYEKAISKC